MPYQLTLSPCNKLLTNTNVWAFDGSAIVYDVRSDQDGSCFDGNRIESVNVRTGQTSLLFQAAEGAFCGVVTCSPVDERIVFIHSLDQGIYAPSRRYGVILHPGGKAERFDGCRLTPPFTPGSLRGGSHVHVFSGDGRWISFTYQDEVLHRLDCHGSELEHDPDLRNVGVGADQPRNPDGTYFTVLISQTVASPLPGSDEISKAYEDAWVGTDGYLKPDGSRQQRAVAFLGDTLSTDGTVQTDVFIADLPTDLTREGVRPLAGTETRRPFPPCGVVQRRLTYLGVKGPRHWVRSSPDGSRIAFLFEDKNGMIQIGTVSPNGGKMEPLTQNAWSVTSAFNWSPDGTSIAYVMDKSLFITRLTGETHRLTPPAGTDNEAPLPYCVAFSPDGKQIAFQRRVLHPNGKNYNQVFVEQQIPTLP
jgi:Tol biopolymer transport system component